MGIVRMTMRRARLICMMALIMVVAAAEPADFAPGNYDYEEENSVEPPPQLLGVPYLTPKTLLLHKLMVAMLTADDTRKMIQSSYKMSAHYQYDNQSQLPFEDLKEDGIMKRTDAIGSVAGHSGPGGRGISGSGSYFSLDSGRKWNKMKKGKAVRSGAHMMCYFKLCAFRPPNIN